MEDEIFEFPKLIDSNFESGIITYNNDLKNPREKVTECSLKINEVNGDKTNINFLIDFPTLNNLNYQLKSMLNQINQTITQFSK